jgi:hypothetical protein
MLSIDAAPQQRERSKFYSPMWNETCDKSGATSGTLVFAQCQRDVRTNVLQAEKRAATFG